MGSDDRGESTRTDSGDTFKRWHGRGVNQKGAGVNKECEGSRVNHLDVL
jgi:hypothetical protein